MRRTIIATAATVAALSAAGGAALAAGGSSSPDSNGGAAASTSRLDDGKDLLPQARISEEAAIAAAQTAASGALNEVDLEHYQGKLVWNVDVGAADVKVDASTGEVLGTPQDDPAGSKD
jgi:uncharacterized membrane protein YkoI